MFESGFGKRPKHKKFGYIPRFYDEEKERLQQTVDRHQGDTSDADKVKERISAGLRHRYTGDEAYKKSHVKKSNLRIVYVLVILCFMTYLILTSDRIQMILETFG